MTFEEAVAKFQSVMANSKIISCILFRNNYCFVISEGTEQFPYVSPIFVDPYSGNLFRGDTNIEAGNEEEITQAPKIVIDEQGDKEWMDSIKRKIRKRDIAAMAEGVGKSASKFFAKAKAKAVEAIDQNADGKLDMQDVSKLAGALRNSVQKTAMNLKETADQKALELEKKALMPIFDEDIDSAGFALTKMLRICEPDKRRLESEVCRGSIGFMSEQKDINVVNIFRANKDKLGITFYPDDGYEFYYVDPRDRDRYIALDEYFAYLKLERVNELQRLAQDLGAKHFRVTYKEEKTSFTMDRQNLNAKIVKLQAAVNKAEEERNFTTVEIAAEMECPGHEPVMPTALNYLKNDSSIQNLIAMRMDKTSPLSHQKFTIKMSNSSGIKENDAMKIDAALKTFKCAGNYTVVNEAMNEAKRYLEYEIDF